MKYLIKNVFLLIFLTFLTGYLQPVFAANCAASGPTTCYNLQPYSTCGGIAGGKDCTLDSQCFPQQCLPAGSRYTPYTDNSCAGWAADNTCGNHGYGCPDSNGNMRSFSCVLNGGSCPAGQIFCSGCNACFSNSQTCNQWVAQGCGGSSGGGGGSGGGGTTCNGDCAVPQGSNCGTEGHVPGSGTCSNGNLCCVPSGGALAYGVQRFYAYCQDGNGPQYPLPGIRIQLTGSNNNPPPGTTTYAAVTTDANGRASYDSPLNPLSSFPSQNYTTSFTDMPWQWTANQNPWSGTSMGGNTVPATGQLYANLTRGDTYNRLQTYPSIFENTYMPSGSPWACDGAYTGGNCNGWFGGGWANPAGGWATNPAPAGYSFNLPSYGNGNYAASFHFSNCIPACVIPGTPTLIVPVANGTVTLSGGQATIIWGAAANAGKYDLELYPTGTSCADPNAFCTYTNAGGGIAGTSYTFTPVTSTYTFRVRGAATNCTGPNLGAWNGTDFTIVSTITGTLYNDPQQTATFNAGTGLCQTGSALNPQAPDAGTTIKATWPSGGTSTGTITGTTYSIPNVPFNNPAVNVTLSIPSSSQYRCICPGGCSFSGSLGGSSNVNYYISNVANPWWQAGNGLVWAGQTTGQALKSQIPPVSCNAGTLCKPYVITRDQAGTLTSAGYVITGGGSIAAQDATMLSEDARPDHVIGATYNGQPENYTYFANLINASFPGVDYSSGTITAKPAAAPINGKAYYASTATTLSGAAWTVTSGQSYVFFINGDLRISTPIYVNPGGFIAFIVKGNITFDKTVGWADPNQTQAIMSGVYIADNQIIVEGGNVGGDLKFVGEGSFVGWGGVQLNRVYPNIITNNTHPMEVFRYRPDFMFNVPDGLSKPFQLWQETN